MIYVLIPIFLGIAFMLRAQRRAIIALQDVIATRDVRLRKEFYSISCLQQRAARSFPMLKEFERDTVGKQIEALGRRINEVAGREVT